MNITVPQLAKISLSGGQPANMQSIVVALNAYGASSGLDQPHRLAQFLAQAGEESGGFRYDRELWGPTPAQAKYDTRVDLGNTPAVDGDGKKNAGRGPFQVTGGGNIKRFYDWCLAQGYAPPDFVANPDLINTDPWEGLSAIWYWTVGNPTHKSLNVLADENNIEQITKRINGGLTGFDLRLQYYVRTALVLLGYEPTDVHGFQVEAQRKGLLPADVPGAATQLDGDAGPQTRAALHMSLARLVPPTIAAAAGPAVIKPAPVVQDKEVPVPVVPQGADKVNLARLYAVIGVVAPGVGSVFFGGDPTLKYIGIAIGAVAVLGLLWKGEVIASRVKALVGAFEVS